VISISFIGGGQKLQIHKSPMQVKNEFQGGSEILWNDIPQSIHETDLIVHSLARKHLSSTRFDIPIEMPLIQ
jgi:hypothetical protein